jgi:hypothetical protein
MRLIRSACPVLSPRVLTHPEGVERIGGEVGAADHAEVGPDLQFGGANPFT